MHPQHAVGPARRRAEGGDRDRRRVRRQDDLGLRDGVERAEQGALGLEVLDDGLDDEVGAGEGADDAAEAEPAERRVTVGGVHLALLDELAEALFDRGPGAVERGRRRVHDVHGEALVCEHLRDAVAHGARADDANGSDG